MIIVSRETEDKESVGWLVSADTSIENIKKSIPTNQHLGNRNIITTRKNLDDMYKGYHTQMESLIKNKFDIVNDLINNPNEFEIYEEFKEYHGGENHNLQAFHTIGDPSVIVVNILPNESGVTIVREINIDEKTNLDLNDIKQIIFTSFDTHGKHSEKVIFAGSILDKGHPLDLNVQPKDKLYRITEKMVNYFPEAKSVTNFDKKGPEMDFDINSPGVSQDGVDLFGEEFSRIAKYQEYFPSGTPVFGSLIAPKATLLFDSVNINGFTYVKNIHFRNGFEVHYMKNPWLFSGEKPVDPEKPIDPGEPSDLDKPTNTDHTNNSEEDQIVIKNDQPNKENSGWGYFTKYGYRS